MHAIGSVGEGIGCDTLFQRMFEYESIVDMLILNLQHCFFFCSSYAYSGHDHHLYSIKKYDMTVASRRSIT